jgi:S-adenosylmethionine/arginine decarboxylase-like enzyme
MAFEVVVVDVALHMVVDHILNLDVVEEVDAVELVVNIHMALHTFDEDHVVVLVVYTLETVLHTLDLK